MRKVPPLNPDFLNLLTANSDLMKQEEKHLTAAPVSGGTQSSPGDPRDGAVAVALERLQEARRGDALTEVVTGVGGQSEVAVNKRHEGKGLRQALEVGFLLWKHTLESLIVLYPMKTLT